MPDIILIGDSIRMSYQQAVQQQLGARATLWWPETNGGSTTNVLANLEPWVLSRPCDLLHLNAGLHDLRTIDLDGRDAIVPIEVYQRNLRLMLRTIQTKTPAAIIFATTTPVIDARHQAKKTFTRRNADVLAYNRVAVSICNELGVPVNDLHAFVAERGAERMIGADGVHFTPEAAAELGQRVAEVIAARMG